MGNRKVATDFYNQAVSAVNDVNNPTRLNHAYQLFSSACLTDPTWGEAWYQAGNNNNDLASVNAPPVQDNLYRAAVACWREALNGATDKTLRAKIMCNLSWRLHGFGRVDEAYEFAAQSVELDPSLDAPWINLSVIHTTLDQPATAVECAKKAFDLAPQNAMAEFAYGMALLFNRRWQLGFKHLEARFAYKLKNYLQYPYPKWSGEEGCQLYIVADQGIGDTLTFARFVERACQRAKYVHANVQPELYPLFQQAFYKIQNLNLLPAGNAFPAADFWTTYVSLPSALGLSDDEIVGAKHIAIDKRDVPTSWKVPDRKLHIGIAWAGSPLNDIDKHRNIPIAQFLELYRVPGVQLYSLQKSERNKEMYDAGCMPLIVDLVPYIASAAETVALVRKLDLVICCESALAHICALADVECWIPYSYLGRDYRIGNLGTDILWAPKAKVFRQEPGMAWQKPFENIIEALKARIDVHA